MIKAVAHLQHELANIRTGRATTGMLDHLKVDAYGNKVPFKAIGTVAVRESHVLAVMLFDQQLASAAMSAISTSPLQLNPRMEGEEILIPVPPPTKETIESMRKLCKAEGESAKVTVRHARKLALDALKSISSDDKKRRAEKEVQTLTDKFIAEIDGIVASKQKDIERHTS
jgi:ribosome recycling factor